MARLNSLARWHIGCSVDTGATMVEDAMTRQHWIAMVSAAGLAAVLGGCDQRHPGETAGQKLDRATRDISASTKEAAAKTEAALDDGAITAKVKAAIFAEPGLKTLQIEVDTKDAVVTLSGSVDTADLRDRAVKIAGSLNGVRQVVDRLVVKS
jgi:hyperosmotically inducible protein